MSKIIGKKIVRCRTIDSTSDEARRLIKKGGGEGLVVVAGRQTRGRGKPGSAWFSPPGNLYFSAVVKPYKDPRDLAPLTLLSALAARALIVRLAKLPVVIKWPNDLRVRGKKVGGILTERLPSGHIIIGIGLNVNAPRRAFPAPLRASATSLAIEAKRKFNLARCAALLSGLLDREYREFLEKR
ncbi:MAG: biotin--[acetyl-CoA-carboxylase] ligase [Candidatus Saganbacteria bacterium]|nr:biotin--[acetyl-CoA-carboxylase] ligase [Candidatus Saganbacteria bacterium]